VPRVWDSGLEVVKSGSFRQPIDERSVEFRSRLEPDVAKAIGLGCSLWRKQQVQEHLGAVARIGCTVGMIDPCVRTASQILP
jgi:hypothetical protein